MTLKLRLSFFKVVVAEHLAKQLSVIVSERGGQVLGREGVLFDDLFGQDMALLHFVGDAFENDKEDNNEPNEMGPDVARLIV